jgi:hypothetical protein
MTTPYNPNTAPVAPDQSATSSGPPTPPMAQDERQALIQRAESASTLESLATLRTDIAAYLAVHPEDEGLVALDQQLGVTQNTLGEHHKDSFEYLTSANQ